MRKEPVKKLDMVVVKKPNENIRNTTFEAIKESHKKIKETLENKTYVLTTYQLKIINYLIAKANVNNGEFETFTFTYYRFAKELNVSVGTSQYDAIYDALISLGEMSFWHKNKDGDYVSKHWFNDETLISPNREEIRIGLSECLKEVFLNLTDNYTSYLYGFAAYFNSKYTGRLYEYLRSYLNFGKATVNIFDLYLKIADNKYTTINKFKKYVLEPAIKEINEKSDMMVSVKENYNRQNEVNSIFFSLHDKSLVEKKDIAINLWKYNRQDIEEGRYDEFLANKRWMLVPVEDDKGFKSYHKRPKTKEDFKREEEAKKMEQQRQISIRRKKEEKFYTEEKKKQIQEIYDRNQKNIRAELEEIDVAYDWQKDESAGLPF